MLPTRYFSPLIGLGFSLTALYVWILMMLRPQDPAVFSLWMLSLVVLVARFRFHEFQKGLLLELIAWLILSFFVDTAFLLSLPTAMVALYSGKTYALFYPMFMWAAFSLFVFEALLPVLFTIVVGVILYGWSVTRDALNKQVDIHREKLYDFEQERQYLLENQGEISRLSTLTERDRIANQLHDDLGHELIGALMALRALEVQDSPAKESESFQKLKKRITRSVEQLKKTVENTKSEEEIGSDRFKHVLKSFAYCPVEHTRKGSIDTLSPMHWHLLTSVLKEAFTNVQKHSHATLVNVDLEVDASVARLAVKNDGIQTNSYKTGMGLRYMRRRLEGVGGALSIQKDYYFKLVCVIPLEMEEVAT